VRTVIRNLPPGIANAPGNYNVRFVEAANDTMYFEYVGPEPIEIVDKSTTTYPDNDNEIRKNLASLNEIVAELVTAFAVGESPDVPFSEVTRQTLREHSHAIGFDFQGEQPPYGSFQGEYVTHGDPKVVRDAISPLRDIAEEMDQVLADLTNAPGNNVKGFIESWRNRITEIVG
jgi:hypothetical protein